MKKIFRSFKFIIEFAKMQITSGMIYRFAFWGSFVYFIGFSIIQFAMFGVIAQNGSIGGWNIYKLYIFTGTFMAVNGLNVGICYFGIFSIPDRIRRGTMDFALTKPVSTIVFVTYGSVDVGSFLGTVIGLAVAFYCAAKIGVLSAVSVLVYLLAIVLMFFLLYSIQLLIYSAAFWIVKTTAINETIQTMQDFSSKLPSPAIRGIYMILLYIVFPYGMIANVPANALFGNMKLSYWVIAILVTAFFYFIAVLVWKIGLNRYDSVSS